jgi:hypothetical protein
MHQYYFETSVNDLYCVIPHSNYKTGIITLYIMEFAWRWYMFLYCVISWVLEIDIWSRLAFEPQVAWALPLGPKHYYEVSRPHAMIISAIEGFFYGCTWYSPFFNKYSYATCTFHTSCSSRWTKMKIHQSVVFVDIASLIILPHLPPGKM